MPDLSQTPVAELIQQFEDDVTVRHSQLPLNVHLNYYSYAMPELCRRGRKVLREIGERIEVLFPTGDFRNGGEVKENLFQAWGWLLLAIVRKHNLHESKPYDEHHVHLADQDMRVWAKFCLEHATQVE